MSALGDWMYGVALVAVVYSRSHSATWVAVVSAVRMLAYVAAGPVGGLIADRLDRWRVMVTADVCRAALLAGLTVAVTTNAGPLAFVLLAALAMAAGSPHAAAFTAVLPSVVGDEELVAANALWSAVHSIALVVGPALGGVLVGVGRADVAFAVNAASFAVSAAFTERSRRTSSRKVGSAVSPSPAGAGSLRSDLLSGARALMSDASTRALSAAYVGVSWVYGTGTVLFVLASVRLLHTGTHGLGWLLAAAGLGGLIATPVVTQLDRGDRLHRTVALALLAAGIPTVLLAAPRIPWLALLVMPLDGAGSVVVEVLALAGVQRRVPEQLRGRAYAFLDMAGVAGIVLGAAVAPVLVAALGLRVALLIGGGLAPALLLVVWPAQARLDRSQGLLAEQQAA